MQTATDYVLGMWGGYVVCRVKGSVAALADLVFLVLEGQRGWSPGALDCSLVQFHHLLGEIVE